MNSEARRHGGKEARSEGRGGSRRFALRAFVPSCLRACILLTCFVLSVPSASQASPSQDDVFKKIQESVGEKEELDYTPVLYLAGGGTVLVLVLWLINRRRQAPSAPKSLNHTGKLMKEVLREVPLTAAEIRQLKLVADSVQQQTGEPATPITMLLCPSLLAKGLQGKPARLDRKALAQVVRKMQLAPQGQPKRRDGA